MAAPGLIIAAPHVCTFPERCTPGTPGNLCDPGCDADSALYAEHIHRALTAEGVRVTMVLSRERRGDCDNNRATCRDSAFRRELRAELVQQTDQAPASVPVPVLELHTYAAGSFDREGQRPPVRSQTVVLRRHRGEWARWELAVAGELGATLLAGSRLNDISLEMSALGQWHVLLEVEQGLRGEDLEELGAGVWRALQTWSSSGAGLLESK